MLIKKELITNAESLCLCCRADSGKAPTKERRAGKWGDYKCDLNPKVFLSLLDHLKNDIKPDYLIWGGDTIPHNIDSLTFESNVQIMKNVT